jgi:general stress protein CsbA
MILFYQPEKVNPLSVSGVRDQRLFYEKVIALQLACILSASSIKSTHTKNNIIVRTVAFSF